MEYCKALVTLETESWKTLKVKTNEHYSREYRKLKLVDLKLNDLSPQKAESLLHTAALNSNRAH